MPPLPDFDPRRKLGQLCRRHGLSDEAGAHLLPLLERSAKHRPDLRLKAIDFVDRQLRVLAEAQARSRRAAALRDEACLRAVAPLLHRWQPARGDSGLEPAD
jgi:hypothetical protein